MRLKEFLLNEESEKTIFHASSYKFSSFKARPTWFSLNEKDALAWHNSGSGIGDQISYICKYTGGKIASEVQAEKIAKQVWPDDDFIYSMYDETVGEFDKPDIQKFISLLKNAGYDGSYIDDYDPADFSAGSSKSLVVFDPSKSVKIEDTMKIDKIGKSEGPQLSDFKKGDRIQFHDNSLTKHNGTIIELLPKGTKAKGASVEQQEGIDYKDSLKIKSDDPINNLSGNRDYFLTLYKHTEIKHI